MDENIVTSIKNSLLGNICNIPHLGGHLITIVDEEGRSRTSLASQEVLRPGEIGVVFCLPIFGAPTRRLPDVNLCGEEYVRIFCGLTTLDVYCERRVSGPPTQTVSMRPGEFVVITCDR
ncbi:hypothetical protein [Bacillus sp. CHD6a]|uniref:hypothetical protein n=1 Tax=Bacillus sp. CHD6a TaxID=1643452 RepID=UPI0006CC9648|nr:hypothetical protein [Bacillus sp. CHD6a]KPB04513.1 hypothetical protein AAV98_11350 [Bacillus sp. CHD6a]